MKALTYSSAAIFTSISILGLLFKMMHWPGAGIALALGISGIALIVVPIVAMYKFRAVKSQN